MDDLVYRSPMFRVPVASDQPSTTDENNYSTLNRVRDILSQGIHDLSKDFNAFDVLSASSKKEASEKLLLDVMARQMAHAILQPLLDAIENATQQIDNRYREK